MKIQIKKIQKLDNIPSASGIEAVGEYLFIIGDDSNILFILKNDEICFKIQLYEVKSPIQDNRIKKKEKKDLESITKINFKGEDYILIAGSGSKEKREDAYLVKAIPPFESTNYPLHDFYSTLKTNQDIVGDRKLNIEGLAVLNDLVFFFQRGNISGINVVISMKCASFLSYITQESLDFPDYEIQNFKLPNINNILSGFSGASGIEGTTSILFTASVENTSDEIDDGANLGSFIGLMDLNKQNEKLVIEQIIFEEKEYLGKIESIAISKIIDNKLIAYSVTDNDLGDSDMLELEIIL